MAIDRWTTVSLRRSGQVRLRLRSEDEAEALDVSVPIEDASGVTPRWGRYVAGVAAQLRLEHGVDGDVSTTIPIGSGLSSSAALEVAAALALGFVGSVVELASLCQRAENTSTGLPSGILDQLTSAAGVDGHTLLMDCHQRSIMPVPLPSDALIQVLFVAPRRLVGSPYGERVAQCAAAEAVVGPLRLATGLGPLAAIEDPLVRRRASHVVTENQRVRDFTSALRSGDLVGAGDLMNESHESLRHDYDTSTPAMDAAAASLRERSDVFGARMTGGGFGGCVVALTDPEADLPGAWRVRPVGGAHIIS